MNNRSCFIILLLCGIFFISCSSKKLPISNFVSLSEPVSFNGTYLNKNDTFANLFNLGRDKTDFVTIEYSRAHIDTLKLSYFTENGLKHRHLKGKLKDNFFEIYFENKRIYVPFIYTVHSVDRLRIGAGYDSDLLLYKLDENFGWAFFVLAGGSISDEASYSFSKFNFTEADFPIPFQQNEKWGFMDNGKNILIDAKYDFVRLFDADIARVKVNGKWGLINKQGKELTTLKYDEIHKIDGGIMRVYSNNKIGYLTPEGVEIIPPVYDEIDYLGEHRQFNSITKKGNKYGYASIMGVLHPPIFDEAAVFSTYICFFDSKNTIKYGKVKYKGESYLLGEDGYMYKYKCAFDKLTLFEDTKVKVSDLYEE